MPPKAISVEKIAMSDQELDDIRRIRQQISAQYGYDAKKLAEDLPIA